MGLAFIREPSGRDAGALRRRSGAMPVLIREFERPLTSDFLYASISLEFKNNKGCSFKSGGGIISKNCRMDRFRLVLSFE